MPINEILAAQLKAHSPDPEAVIAADRILISEGYQFIGYHGCHLASLKNIVPYHFDPHFSGKGEGNSKGKGFYLSWKRSLSESYADSATHSGDPLPSPDNSTLTVVPRYPGELGISKVIRIYARNFTSMNLGIDYTWGVQCSDGDPNNDKSITSYSGQNYKNLDHDLELIFRFTSYPDLAAIPSVGKIIDQSLSHRVPWPPLKTDDVDNPFEILPQYKKDAKLPFEYLTKTEMTETFQKPLIISQNYPSNIQPSLPAISLGTDLSLKKTKSW